MTVASITQLSKKAKAAIWLSVAAGVLLVVLANLHLIYVATTSQPDCVAHVRPGAVSTAHGLFSAAQSSCSPR